MFNLLLFYLINTSAFKTVSPKWCNSLYKKSNLEDIFENKKVNNPFLLATQWDCVYIVNSMWIKVVMLGPPTCELGPLRHKPFSSYNFRPRAELLDCRHSKKLNGLYWLLLKDITTVNTGPASTVQMYYLHRTILKNYIIINTISKHCNF